MKNEKYKLKKEEREAIRGLCRFLLQVTKSAPIKEIHFIREESKKFDKGTLTFYRQRDSNDKQIDKLTVKIKTKS